MPPWKYVHKKHIESIHKKVYKKNLWNIRCFAKITSKNN